MTQKYEIKNRFTGEVLFSCDIPEGMESGMIARHALETAIADGANLEGANLQCANLWGANLRDANLCGVNLRDANLCGVNLRDANLRDANLWGANLRDANLCGVNLRDAKNAPVIISGLRWTVHISGTGMMRIGCQNHSVEAWKNFTDEEIKIMDSDALEFWSKYKTMLLVACDTNVHAKEIGA